MTSLDPSILRDGDLSQDSTAKVKCPKVKIFLDNPRIFRLQYRVALVSVIVPTLGTIVALGSLPFWGISAVSAALLMVFYSLTMAGIIVGFHRYFSHRAFETTRPICALLLILGSMAMQGPLINWVATHRRHHKYSDVSLDAHSPHWRGEEPVSGIRGFWHGHIGWMFVSKITNSALFAKDLLQDPLVVRLNRRYFTWIGLGLLLPTVLGGVFTQSWQGGCQGLLWGGFVRIFLVHHACWAISSVSHNYGARPFATPDRSTNNFWLAIPTFGGTWHNNHHAFPRSPITGLMWWQVDIGGVIVQFLKLLGLAWNLKTPSPNLIESRQTRRELTDML